MVGDFSGFEGFVFDFDGVVWLGDNLIEGARDTIESLRRAGKKVAFATNNASKSRKAYAEKLRSLGIHADHWEIETSASAAAKVIKDRGGASKVYAVGMDGLTFELMMAGHTLSDKKPDYVVSAHDETFTYDKLKTAFECIHYAGAKYIAANPDKVGPRDGKLVPASGCIMAAIEYATGVKAEVVGKPEKQIMEAALKSMDLQASQVLVVGDTLDYDIMAGKNAGAKTALVLTGVDSRESAEEKGIQPDFIIDGIKDLKV